MAILCFHYTKLEYGVTGRRHWLFIRPTTSTLRVVLSQCLASQCWIELVYSRLSRSWKYQSCLAGLDATALKLPSLT